VATRVRDWAAYDFYALLGVDADATDDDIARAFRRAAKRSHPDATADPAAAERFKDLAAAYSVLSDHRARRDYDRVRAAPSVGAAPADPPARQLPRTRWTRRRAWTALLAGVLVFVCGVLAGATDDGRAYRVHDGRRRAHRHQRTRAPRRPDRSRTDGTCPL
jgi:curved DNA-binding protein CbpA